MSWRRVAFGVLVCAPVAAGVTLGVWAYLLEGAFEGLGAQIMAPHLVCARSVALGCFVTSGGGLPSAELGDLWYWLLLIQPVEGP